MYRIAGHARLDKWGKAFVTLGISEEEKLAGIIARWKGSFLNSSSLAILTVKGFLRAS